MAFTGVAALMSGAAMTTATVLAAVAEIGMIMTVVGTVTGSKELMKIGGAMALVGGVGGMINGAMTSAAAAGAESMGSMASAADAAFGGEAGMAASQAEGIAAMGGEAATDGIVSGAATMPPDLATSTIQTPTHELTGMAKPPEIQAGAPSVDAGAVQQAPGIISPQGPADITAPTGPQGITVPPNPAMGQNAPQSSGSFWNSFTSFADKNKSLLGAGLQLAGGLAKGANDSAMWNEKMELDRQKLGQTSFGSQTANTAPRPSGIIAGARA